MASTAEYKPRMHLGRSVLALGPDPTRSGSSHLRCVGTLLNHSLHTLLTSCVNGLPHIRSWARWLIARTNTDRFKRSIGCGARIGNRDRHPADSIPLVVTRATATARRTGTRAACRATANATRAVRLTRATNAAGTDATGTDTRRARTGSAPRSGARATRTGTAAIAATTGWLATRTTGTAAAWARAATAWSR